MEYPRVKTTVNPKEVYHKILGDSYSPYLRFTAELYRLDTDCKLQLLEYLKDNFTWFEAQYHEEDYWDNPENRYSFVKYHSSEKEGEDYYTGIECLEEMLSDFDKIRAEVGYWIERFKLVYENENRKSYIEKEPIKEEIVSSEKLKKIIQDFRIVVSKRIEPEEEFIDKLYHYSDRFIDVPIDQFALHFSEKWDGSKIEFNGHATTAVFYFQCLLGFRLLETNKPGYLALHHFQFNGKSFSKNDIEKFQSRAEDRYNDFMKSPDDSTSKRLKNFGYKEILDYTKNLAERFLPTKQ